MGIRSINLRPSRWAPASIAVAALVAAAIGVACKKAEPPAMPPLVVAVAPPIQKDVPIFQDWIGVLDGFINAQIRPQVEGYLLRQDYKEGSYVHAGDTLFEIDPRTFQAAYDQAKGNLAQYQATLENAKVTVARYKPLAAEKAISQQELDNAETNQRTAQANVEATQAALEKAQLNLTWCKVLSPIEGVSGIAKAQVGNLINPNTDMTTVSQVNPIKVYFNPSEMEYMAWVEKHGPMTKTIEEGASLEQGPLQLILADGSVYGHRGKPFLAGREVDVKTGTITLAGVFPNPENLLRPGQYGKIRVQTDMKKGALLVPQRAVSELQGNFQIAVVGPDNKVEIRAVQPGPRFGSLWVIEKGLSAGDKVIVEGAEKVRPGMAVNPQPAPPEAPAAAEKGSTTGSGS
jgi:membrane fusion protein (multidrug efflux system)